jgi:hypothetical protein
MAAVYYCRGTGTNSAGNTSVVYEIALLLFLMMTAVWLGAPATAEVTI